MVPPCPSPGYSVKALFALDSGPNLSLYRLRTRPRHLWLIIINTLGLSRWRGLHSPSSVLPMRISSAFLFDALLVGGLLFVVSAAHADSRVFIIANQADGYGVDQCLAKGDKCGAHAARSYCQSREFAQATAYRRVDPDEITGSVPKGSEKCSGGGCNEYVAITCQR
jgi:hypothetical protein